MTEKIDAKIRSQRLHDRCEIGLAYWDSIRVGDTIYIGQNAFVVTGKTPTRIITGDRRWGPRDLQLGREASTEINKRYSGRNRKMANINNRGL